MKKRVISAAVIIPIVVLAIYFSGIVFQLLVLAIMLGAIYEMKRSLKIVEINTMFIMNYVYAIVAAVTVYFGESKHLLAILLLFSIITFSISMLMPKYDVKDAIGTIFVFVYPTTLILLLNILQQFGREYIVGAIIASVITDTAAFFVGRRFGDTKLCPNISPNKTVAGAIGGAAATTILFPIYWLVVSLINGTPIGVVNVLMWVLIALLCGIFAQFGDLFASSIKRYCGLKDFSNLIPGHGGIMDRLDSIMFTTVLVYLFTVLGII